ncbi:Hydantoinase/dihydropyrimidinase [Moorella glycerini]|uniref:D-phenylhydantoinase n=1 Tax=Neomoorella stamsii TaxID=1266720 RepID=A0A9X7J106_9FIRM|nr:MULTISPECIES: dihydropyrimidinase [Moorella]PRR68894.1 D-phenylhydantoinase [Moorella stamsii]CEP67515.1 Hydantoinase/dihydropyrimidinase [Moorella glycerini]
MDLLLKGGWVVTAARVEQADVAIKGEKIAAVGPDLAAPGAVVRDVTGKYILPGAIDAHVHYQMPIGDLLTADDWFTGTRLAACGGVTTVIDYAEPASPGESLTEALTKRLEEATDQACVDYGLHQVVMPGQEEDEAELRAVVEKGVTSFKVFTTYAQRLSLAAIGRLLRQAPRLGALVTVHCEDHEIITAKREELIAAGQTDPAYHAASRPAEAEVKAIRDVIALAREAGAPVYIVHVSTGEGAEAIADARSKGQQVYGETCPHYLLLTESQYTGPDSRLFLMCPPLRTAADNDLLWRHLAGGALQVVATDHCSYSREQKAAGTAFYNTPSGVPGTETLLPLLYSYGVRNGWLTLPQLVQVLATNPARLFGLYPRKGSLKPGSDADLVVFDPRRQVTLTAADLHSAAGYTVFEGFNLQGYLEATYLRGRLIYDRGRFLGQAGQGQFIPGRIATT